MNKLSKKLSNIEITKLSEIKDLEQRNGESVKFRGFVSSIRGMSKAVFMVVRERLETVQAIYNLESEDEEVKAQFKKLKKLQAESYVEITGVITPVEKPIAKCTKKTFEIYVHKIEVLGKIYDKLPFVLQDVVCAERASVGYNVRLDNRALDLRIPATHAMVRVIDETMWAFRSYLRKLDFIEVKSSKIIQSGSEGGANLFSIDYFGKKAYLAQSPQLYKQLCILGGLKRVCEVGHVYRAEVSNINRYLSEFTGLDIEMEMESDYIGFVNFLHTMFYKMFSTIKSNRFEELEIIRQYIPFTEPVIREKPVIYTHKECVDMLKKNAYGIGYTDDFSREQEKVLGRLVKEKDGVDMFICIDYPEEVRAFYTYSENGKTRSYDFILNGEEILSGAQRQTDYEKLKEAILKKGINPESLNNYLEPFKYGAPPHIGCGIGLERLLKAYFGFDDIRHFALFPRDPNRLYP